MAQKTQESDQNSQKTIQKVAEIEVRLIKQGNSFGFRVPKALMDCKVISDEKTYTAVIFEEESKPLKKEAIKRSTNAALSQRGQSSYFSGSIVTELIIEPRGLAVGWS